jgi:hypothetical protein
VSCIDGKCQQAAPSPKLTIVSPSSGKYFEADGGSSPVTVEFVVTGWDPWPETGKTANCYVDGQPDGQTQTGSYTFPAVPFGMHRLTCQLVFDGKPLLSCVSYDSVTVKVRRPCVTQADCIDSNPCSVEVCAASPGGKFCAYTEGKYSQSCCCLSNYDCPCYSMPGGGAEWLACEYNDCHSCLTDESCWDMDECTIDSCDPCTGCKNEWVECK